MPLIYPISSHVTFLPLFRHSMWHGGHTQCCQVSHHCVPLRLKCPISDSWHGSLFASFLSCLNHAKCVPPWPQFKSPAKTEETWTDTVYWSLIERYFLHLTPALVSPTLFSYRGSNQMHTLLVVKIASTIQYLDTVSLERSIHLMEPTADIFSHLSPFGFPQQCKPNSASTGNSTPKKVCTIDLPSLHSQPRGQTNQAGKKRWQKAQKTYTCHVTNALSFVHIAEKAALYSNSNTLPGSFFFGTWATPSIISQAFPYNQMYSLPLVDDTLNETDNKLSCEVIHFAEERLDKEKTSTCLTTDNEYKKILVLVYNKPQYQTTNDL